MTTTFKFECWPSVCDGWAASGRAQGVEGGSFEKRPVCFTGLGAGIWGALRPVEQLQAIFGYRNAYLFPERVFLPRINELLDDAGRLKDPELLQRLKSQAEGFVDFVERLQKIRLRG